MSAITDQIEELYATIDDGTDPRVQRAAVGALIVAALPELEPTPTYWVKAHIAGACSALHDNAIRLNPSTMWLRLSLLDLRHAFLPWDSVNEDYTARNHAIDRMPFSRLARAAMAVVEESVAL